MLIFLDLETTGLDPHEGCTPIEVAAVAMDDTLTELGSFESLIQPGGIWDEAAMKMHRSSGLHDLAQDNGPGRRVVGVALNDWLGRMTDKHQDATFHLAGNSIHFDRGFIRQYWPDVDALLHHRMLDVSSLRMVGERVITANGLSGEKPHRAMADVRRSIEELRHWVTMLRYSGLRPSASGFLL